MGSVAAIIAGAGAGTRLGANIPKALVLLSGEPLIVHSVRAMQQAGISEIVVTIPDGFETQFAAALSAAHLDAKLVIGGATRQESVAKGLAETNAEYILVHDAARALTPPQTILSVVDALNKGAKAVIPALPVVDTIKRGISQKNADGETQISVAETLCRSELYSVQTPQGFSRELLQRAHIAGAKLSANEGSAAPDDAALVELLNEPVEIVSGHPNALKITTPFDLEVAQLLADKLSAVASVN